MRKLIIIDSRNGIVTKVNASVPNDVLQVKPGYKLHIVIGHIEKYKGYVRIGDPIFSPISNLRTDEFEKEN